MIQAVLDQNSTLVESQETLSELVIPAVPGEYYAYPSRFTKDRPLYVFMKCKANKSRPIDDAESLGREANLLFLFGRQTHVCAIKAANISGLLNKPIDNESFGETWISPVEITPKDFYNLRSQKDVETLVETCRVSCAKREVSLALEPEMIIAMMTDGGKYGMFLVKELTSTSIQIDACHILL